MIDINSSKGTLKNIDKYSATCFTKEGSLILPRWGVGVKKGLSVSINTEDNGIFFITLLSSSAFLKVIMPDNDI